MEGNVEDEVDEVDEEDEEDEEEKDLDGVLRGLVGLAVFRVADLVIPVRYSSYAPRRAAGCPSTIVSTHGSGSTRSGSLWDECSST